MRRLMDQLWINKLHLVMFAYYECIYYKIMKAGTKKRKFDYYVNGEKLEKKGHLELKVLIERHTCILKGAKVHFYQEHGQDAFKLPDGFNLDKALQEVKRFSYGFGPKYNFGYLREIVQDYK